MHNIFFYLFKQNEPALIFIIIFYIIVIRLISPKYFINYDISSFAIYNSYFVILLVSICAFLLVLVGTHFVYHSYPLCMDEYLTNFQAHILLKGKIVAPIPNAWRDLARPLASTYVHISPDNHFWVPQYLPGYAALKAIFLYFSLPSLLNPLLGGISVLLIAHISKKIWPEDKYAPVLAAVLLFSSSQFLITSMSYYSWPAHLCLNLLWLSLYLSSHASAFYALPWVGVFAINLHQPHVHLLFACPFLITILRTRPIRSVLYVAIVYAFGCALALYWLKVILPPGIGRTGVPFTIPGIPEVTVRLMNIVYLMSWNNLAMSIFLVVLALNYRPLNPICKNLAWGFLLTFGFYLFFKGTGGHGWGSRYSYSILGNLVLMSVAGFKKVYEVQKLSQAVSVVVLSTVLALLIQFPLRAYQVETFIRPYAETMAYLKSRKTPVVIVDAVSVYYGQDFIRNDPFLLKNPRIMVKSRLTAQQIETLQQRYGVTWVGKDDLVKRGLPPRLDKYRGLYYKLFPLPVIGRVYDTARHLLG
jgi:hypothetical protein